MFEGKYGTLSWKDELWLRLNFVSAEARVTSAEVVKFGFQIQTDY